MEIIQAPVKKFMAKYERYEPKIRDHTAIITAKTCLRKYFLAIVLGFRPKQTKEYFAFGAAYHHFREILQKSGDLQTAIGSVIKYWTKHGKEPQPGTQWDFLTGGRLLASCNAAYQHIKKIEATGQIQILQAEQVFQVMLSDGKTAIGGRADQIVRWNGKLWGVDFKTSSKMGQFYERTLEPNNQFTLYTLAESKLHGERVLGQRVEVLYNTKKEGPKIVTLMTQRTEDQLTRWEGEIIWFEENIIKSCRESDVYPMEETQCPFCPFHSVCKQPTEGAMMAQLDTHFNQVPWNYAEPNKEEVSE